MRDGNCIKLNKRILYITPGFPADESDSTCIPALQEFLLEISKNLGGQQIISLNYPGAGDYNWFGHSVISLGWNNPVKIQKVFLLKLALTALKKIVDENSFDLIHSFWMTDASLIGTQLASYAQIPHVVTIMGQDVKPTHTFKRIMRSKPKLITLSDFQDSLVRSYGQTAVIPWGLSDYWFPREMNRDEFDMVTVGSLIDVKQPEQLITIVALLKNDFPAIRAAFIGDGPHRKFLENKIMALGLQDNIEVLGELNRSDTLGQIAKAKLLFHPSRYEGFGMVLIEALALGTQPIAYATGVAGEIDQVIIIKSAEEAVQVAASYLAGKLPVIPYDPNYAISKTVEKYKKLYNQL